MTLIRQSIKIRSIRVANVVPGTIGQVYFSDMEGRLYVAWENGYSSIVKERGEVYAVVEENKLSKPKNLFCNIKSNFLTLFKN